MNITYTLFFQKSSDLDNMVPVLCGLLDNDKESLGKIVNYGESLKKDSGLLVNYCKKKYADRLVYCHLHNKVDKLLANNDLLSNSQEKNIFSKSTINIYIKSFCRITPKKYNEKEKAGIFANYHKLHSSSSLNEVFLFGFPKKEFIIELLKKIQKNHVFCVRLPQGVLMTMSAFRKLNDCFVPWDAMGYVPKWADLVINTDFFCDQFVHEVRTALGFDVCIHPSTYLALGAPRYSSQWLEELDQIFINIPSKFSSFSKKRRKILFLLTKKVKNVWWEELERVVDIILRYEVNVVVKLFHGDNNASSIIRNAENFSIDEDTPTSALIRDADAVFYIATSASLEAYMRGKEVLQLSYLHGNITILEKFRKGYMAHCRDDIHIYMTRFTNTGRLCKDHKDTIKEDAEQFVLEKIVGENPLSLYVKNINLFAGNYFKK